MKGRRNNGSMLFLTELMFSIFFFAVIAAVCIRIFSGARVLTRESRELTGSVNATANVAEVLGTWDGEEESWEKLFPDGVWTASDTWYQNYDSQWQSVASEGDYVVVMKLDRDGEMIRATITAKSSGQEEAESIYELEVSHCLR
jgi:hypothetical protein